MGSETRLQALSDSDLQGTTGGDLDLLVFLADVAAYQVSPEYRRFRDEAVVAGATAAVLTLIIGRLF